jgi:cell wall-associated NlpC family hydrolase
LIIYPEDRGLLKIRRFAFIGFVAFCIIGSGYVLSEEIKVPYTGIITTSAVNVRSEPDLSSPIIVKVFKDNLIMVVDENTSWCKIKFNTTLEGWIWKQYVRIDRNQINSRGLVKSNVVDYAQKFLNTPYIYGGASSRGFDCSGFTCYIFSKFGYLLPHRALEQVEIGVPVPLDAIQPGDLVFFKTLTAKQINHVGIYIGNGTFIHASSGSGSVRISSLNESYYQQRFQCARRILPSYPSN